ncbi:unnamed protein product [Effrenium voratum]|uniref:Uncharacterized protein n=1 Tax=Effrenium voratum TaxID=2562239 RepID=A0AA36MLM4_9DINO|nr:unnamed protein product [Effrenium voratum]
MEEFDAKLRAAAAKVQLHGTSPPNASKSANSTPENEEPEQEYETPNPEPYIERKTFDISRAELADSELSLQTIGSIARRVSASLGGDARSGASSSKGDDKIRAPRQSRDREVFESLEQEMEHLADMRRYASQVLGVREGSARPVQNEEDRRRSAPAPSPTFGARATSATPVTNAPGSARSSERWKRRPSTREEPPCPWEEPNSEEHHTKAQEAWHQVDSEGRLIF